MKSSMNRKVDLFADICGKTDWHDESMPKKNFYLMKFHVKSESIKKYQIIEKI